MQIPGCSSNKPTQRPKRPALTPLLLSSTTIYELTIHDRRIIRFTCVRQTRRFTAVKAQKKDTREEIVTSHLYEHERSMILVACRICGRRPKRCSLQHRHPPGRLAGRRGRCKALAVSFTRAFYCFSLQTALGSCLP